MFREEADDFILSYLLVNFRFNVKERFIKFFSIYHRFFKCLQNFVYTTECFTMFKNLLIHWWLLWSFLGLSLNFWFLLFILNGITCLAVISYKGFFVKNVLCDGMPLILLESLGLFFRLQQKFGASILYFFFKFFYFFFDPFKNSL